MSTPSRVNEVVRLFPRAEVVLSCELTGSPPSFEGGGLGHSTTGCSRCDPLRLSRLVVRVPAPDVALLLPSRILLTCRDCCAVFVAA